MSNTSSPEILSGNFADDEWPNENWPELEFRSPVDEAWYGVEVWRIYNAFVVSFNGFSSLYDEYYPPDDFKNDQELKEFEERFRASSVQMQDVQCPTLSVGTMVCATCPSVTGEVKFYDAIVVEVIRMEHEWDEEGTEVCGCTFRLFWQKGTCQGAVTSAKVGDICLKPEDNRVNPKVGAFLKEVKRKLHGGASSSGDGEETEWQKTLKKVSSALRNYHLTSSVPETLG